MIDWDNLTWVNLIGLYVLGGVVVYVMIALVLEFLDGLKRIDEDQTYRCTECRFESEDITEFIFNSAESPCVCVSCFEAWHDPELQELAQGDRLRWERKENVR